MSTDGDALPKGWTKADDSDEQSGQYDAQRPIRYEHTDGITVNVQPVAPDAADAERDVWRIGAVPGGGRSPVETLREDVEGRDGAIEVAREFMQTYDERCVEGGETAADVVASF